jgi:hypothetical protein
LDTEYELGNEFIEEIIPHAVEYFAGINHDMDDFIEYTSDQMNKF